MSAEDIDYTDLVAVSNAVTTVRKRMAEIRVQQATARVDKLQKRLAWQHARNLALTQLTGETEATRGALADLQTQGEHSDYLVANAVYEKLNQDAAEARADLEALREAGNNLRRQIELGVL